MKQIFIFLLAIIGVAYGQSSPTSAKTRFVNGIYLGTKLDSYFAAADSNAIYWRADSALMAKYKGTARALAFAVSGGYLPISDTAAMLSPHLRRTDSTGLLSQVVRTFGTQTIGGNKTFSNDIVVNGSSGVTVGRGNNSVVSNTVVGFNSLSSITSGAGNTAIGNNNLSGTTTASNNVSVGNNALQNNINGGANNAFGSSALTNNTDGSNNIAIGQEAARFALSSGSTPLTSVNNSTYIGFQSRASAATGVSNETVIGYGQVGNGSNTVTIGNSSITNNYFTGNIRGGAFIKSGGLSTQFLKADGSVDSTSYATAASISGTTNYIPKFTSASAIGNSRVVDNFGIGLFSGDAIWFDQATGNGRQWGLYYDGTVLKTRIANSDALGFSIASSGQMTLSSQLNGTSLSMSGGASITGELAVGSALLANGYKLNVNGLQRTYGANTVLNFGELDANGVYFQALNNAGDAAKNIIFFGTAEYGRWASDGTFLINTTTTDGTNKLIVNGGVKGIGNIRVANEDSYLSVDDASNLRMGFTKKTGALPKLTFGSATTFAIAASSGTGIEASNTFTDVFTLTTSGAGNISGTFKASGSGGWTIGDVAGENRIQYTSSAFNLYNSGNAFASLNAGAATFSSSVTANSFVKSGGTSTQSLMADGSVQTVTSGTYNPTLTGTANISSLTLDKASFIRVGNFVTVTVYGTVQTTASGASEFTISLPFTAGATAPMSGSGTVANLGVDSRAMFGQYSSTTAIKYYWDSPNTTLKPFSVTFQFGL